VGVVAGIVAEPAIANGASVLAGCSDTGIITLGISDS
jgi:hypothetical protein